MTALMTLLALPAGGQVPGAPATTPAYAKPGDQLVFKGTPQSFFGPPAQYIIDPFGNVTFPQVGAVAVSRIPIADLRDTLATRYQKFVREPEVDVSVLRRVTVNGAVLRPDIYFVDLSATLRDVIARSGGISEVGSRKKVSIVRGGASQRVPNWETDTSAATVLQSGDLVLVGRRSWLEINIIPVASLALAAASLIITVSR